MQSITKIMQFITKAIEDNFWGEIIIKFKNGKPTLILSTSQIKLD